MTDLLQKLIVSETKIKLLEDFISFIEGMKGIEKQFKNYEKQLLAEKRQIKEIAKCIQKRYPPKAE
jgi:hypothetical protein